jgi:hypothetical protein
VLPEGLGNLKESIHLIGSGTRDLPAHSTAPSSCKLLMSIRLFSVHRPGPTVVTAGEGKLGDALPRKGAPSCGQGYLPGPSVQLPGASYGLEMFHVSHLCVSTHLDVSPDDVRISQGGLYHVTVVCTCVNVWRSPIHLNIVTI